MCTTVLPILLFENQLDVFFSLEDFFNVKRICGKTAVCDFQEMKQTYPPSIMNDAEVGFVFELAGLLELSVSALLLDQLVHKSLVCGFGKPALFI